MGDVSSADIGEMARLSAAVRHTAGQLGGVADSLTTSHVGSTDAGEAFADRSRSYLDGFRRIKEQIDAYRDAAEQVSATLQVTYRQYAETDATNATSFEGR